MDMDRRSMIRRSESQELQEDDPKSVRQSIQEGYSTLALIATFISAVEAQILSVTLENEERGTRPFQAFNTLFILSIIFSMYGAVNAALSARWYTLLSQDAAQDLAKRWLFDQNRRDDDLTPLPNADETTISEKWLAFTLSSSIHLTNTGFLCFIAGILTYCWLRQPTTVAVVASAGAAWGMFWMLLFYVRFDFRRVVHQLRFHRFRITPKFVHEWKRRKRTQVDIEQQRHYIPGIGGLNGVANVQPATPPDEGASKRLSS